MSDLAAACQEAFAVHPDAAIITSFSGLGALTGARVLAEIGDDRSRFQDASFLKVYAGSAPVTRASGKSSRVMYRRIKNRRLAAVGHIWAFAALSADGPRQHYDRRRDRGDRHIATLRHLFNRMLGQLHHCLSTRKPYTRRSPSQRAMGPVTQNAQVRRATCEAGSLKGRPTYPDRADCGSIG